MSAPGAIAFALSAADLAVIVGAAAIFTVIGSMGNGPLVAVLSAFALDRTLALNGVALVVALALLWLRRRGLQEAPAPAHA